LKVAAPTTPYDAKGCLIHAIRDNDPVIYVEHRILHFQNGPVPDAPYTVAPGKARVTAAGADVTLVGISHMQLECLRARCYLESVGIHAEVIDPIWLSPLDADTIVESARRTGRLCVVDNGWVTCGAGAEIIALVSERLQGSAPVRVRRMGFAPVTCPPTPTLEDLYYPNARTIAAAAYDLVKGGENGWLPEEKVELQEVQFKGPF
jgi:pyruvate/2-oxoglutarate/acetoin dehydrogenase E1 component